MEVRVLTPADAEAFRDLRLEGLTRQPEAFGASLDDEPVEPLQAWRDRLAQANVFGAFVENRLVGVAGYYRQSGAKLAHNGVLWGLYVREEARGRGAGRALVEAVIAHARGEVTQLGASVNVANPRAQALYESLGFKVWGVRPRALKLGDRLCDEAEMALLFVEQGV